MHRTDGIAGWLIPILRKEVKGIRFELDSNPLSATSSHSIRSRLKYRQHYCCEQIIYDDIGLSLLCTLGPMCQLMVACINRPEWHRSVDINHFRFSWFASSSTERNEKNASHTKKKCYFFNLKRQWLHSNGNFMCLGLDGAKKYDNCLFP